MARYGRSTLNNDYDIRSPSGDQESIFGRYGGESSNRLLPIIFESDMSVEAARSWCHECWRAAYLALILGQPDKYPQ